MTDTHTETTPPATPTEAEREMAMQVMAWDPLNYDAFVADDRDALEIVDAIAQVLADQRARYEAVAAAAAA